MASSAFTTHYGDLSKGHDMTGRFFKTSFGHSIPIVESYRSTLPPLGKPRASSIAETGGEKGEKESPFGIFSDIFQFSMFADWLATTPAGGRKFERLLDIGGSTGLIGQLFKGAGIAKAVDNIEVLDFRDSLDMADVCAILAKIRAGSQELRAESAMDFRLGKLKGGVKNRQIWLMNQLRFMESTFPYPITEHSHFWKFAPDVPLSLDRYILGDLFEHNEKYDFILSSTTMQHFSVAPFLQKAHDLLQPGGVLLIWNAYWYWALIVNRLYGDFPWGAQRLTWEDYERYLSEYQPDHIEASRTAVNVFHKAEKRYTLNDYIAAGKQAGFKPLAHHRLVPPAGLPGKIGAWTLQGDHGSAVQQEVLRDIHCFRPDVEQIDLTTQSVFILLEKQ
jgi:SAM-dependent methyltransferase